MPRRRLPTMPEAYIGQPDDTKLRVFGALPNFPDHSALHQELENEASACYQYEHRQQCQNTKLFGRLPNAFEDISPLWGRALSSSRSGSERPAGLLEVGGRSRTRLFGSLPDAHGGLVRAGIEGHKTSCHRPQSAPPLRMELPCVGTQPKPGGCLSTESWARPSLPTASAPTAKRRVLPPPPAAELPAAVPEVLPARHGPAAVPLSSPAGGGGLPLTSGFESRQRVTAMGATLGALQSAVPWEAQQEGTQDEAKARATTMTMDFLNSMKAQATQRTLGI